MNLFFQYLQLCWFQNDPAELQPSGSFVVKCVAFYVISGIIIEGLIGDPASATIEVLLRLVVAFSLVGILVYVKKKGPAFLQVVTAIFVCENLIVTLGIGAEILDTALRKTPYADLPTVLGVLLLLWYLAIIAYIGRQMFSFRVLQSLGLAVAYFCLTYGGPFLAMEVL